MAGMMLEDVDEDKNLEAGLLEEKPQTPNIVNCQASTKNVRNVCTYFSWYMQQVNSPSILDTDRLIQF